MCASSFSLLVVFHIRRGDLWTVGLAPFLEWRGAGWKLPVSGIQAGEQNRPRDLQHSAEQRAADSGVTAGHLTHKPSTDRHGLSQKCFGHLATSRRFIPSALPCTSLNSEPQKAVWAVREREEQFLREFFGLCVLRGQLWRGHPTLTIKRFSEEAFKGLVQLGTDKTAENKTE